ncbi:putative proline dehydrogenase, mitochondrial [Cytospora mali]|uniref:Proline dehydrogenase n=1 Tax=Cytospora mali TaxID=578113 RepID=A0A194W229_CYTMA|nr:putative proline dehydrogenase, mitochondrial [Valsa mali]
MASVRPLLNVTPRERTMALIPRALSMRNSTFTPSATIETSLLKYRPLRQPQFNRMASSSSRSLHSSSTTRQANAAVGSQTSPTQGADSSPTAPSMTANASPLAILPLTQVIRSLAVTSLSSSRLLLPPSLAIMNILAHTTNPFLNPDRNPILKKLIKTTFYVQFCAGENAAEVKQTMARLKDIGYSGAILGYAKEVVLSKEQTKDLASCGLEGETAEAAIQNEVIPWAQGTLETVRLANPGDYVALKFTGAGRQALWTLSQQLPPPAALASAIDEICVLARDRGVRLLFDAEQQAVQAGIDTWTLDYMRKYNKAEPGKAVIYGTYQAYLKATPWVVAQHLRAAQEEGFTLGVKLVRGAYLGSDPRHLIHDSQADTDACYNGIAEALLRREWTGALAPFAPADTKGKGSFPGVNMVLATHNAESVRKARAILESGERATECAFAQLQGMADEVSCEILALKDHGAKTEDGEVFRPRAYKYLVWGSTGECMKYLLRRAQENKDAVGRTRSGRDAMRAEVWRRLKGAFGLA